MPIKTVTCPYIPQHIMPQQSLLNHLTKCKATNKHLFSRCKYNSIHIYPTDQIDTHYRKCKDKEKFIKNHPDSDDSWGVQQKDNNENTPQNIRGNKHKHQTSKNNKSDQDSDLDIEDFINGQIQSIPKNTNQTRRNTTVRQGSKRTQKSYEQQNNKSRIVQKEQTFLNESVRKEINKGYSKQFKNYGQQSKNYQLKSYQQQNSSQLSILTTNTSVNKSKQQQSTLRLCAQNKQKQTGIANEFKSSSQIDSEQFQFNSDDDKPKKQSSKIQPKSYVTNKSKQKQTVKKQKYNQDKQNAGGTQVIADKLKKLAFQQDQISQQDF